MRPFEGIKVIDATHVLAGPFASYQLGLLGADVIKVEAPDEPDHTRTQGNEKDVRDAGMGSGFLTQSSNKKSITLNLKNETAREAFKRLVAQADILVENYRPGAFEAIGLGYKDLSATNPRLIYCSMSAFGHTGTKRTRTAYDQVIQATSGIMAQTGTEEFNPIRLGAPVIDYSTGMSGAFAMASALFQREKTGRGQRIDLAMLDVAMILMSSHVTSYFLSGHVPKPSQKFPTATAGTYRCKDGAMVMIAASNPRQVKRFWKAIGRDDFASESYDDRLKNRDKQAAAIAELFLTRTADEWEEFFQSRHVPAGRVRTMDEALADPHLTSRGVIHQHQPCDGVGRPFRVPVSPFMFEHGGPRVDAPPRQMGADTDSVLAGIGYSAADIAAMRAAKAI
jgi:crotonobetainyl-CoA:carnitine CoA-transferase CaiB-like acyl-CoA transferase